MTEIPDEIMAKARDALAADTKFRTKVSQLAAIFLRHDRELAIAAALLSERTASEAALKEARDRIAELENERKIYRKALLRVHAKANVMTYCAKENASDWKFVRDTVGSVILAKTGGA